MELSDRIALITGGARGIGREIAQRLADSGASIAVVDVEEDAARAAVAELESGGASARAYRCDVASFDEVEQLGRTVLEDFGRVDILVNNAGITRDQLVIRMTPDDWNLVVAVNLTGAFNFCKAFGPQMLRQRSGSIVNIASVVGQAGNAGQVNYAASKAGVIGLTKALAKEFASRGVRVNAVAPGFIHTAMTEKFSEDVRQKIMEVIPLGRLGEPSDVANIVYFLVSDLSSYVTGQVINCDGGIVMAR